MEFHLRDWQHKDETPRNVTTSIFYRAVVSSREYIFILWTQVFGTNWIRRSKCSELYIVDRRRKPCALLSFSVLHWQSQIVVDFEVSRPFVFLLLWISWKVLSSYATAFEERVSLVEWEVFKCAFKLQFVVRAAGITIPLLRKIEIAHHKPHLGNIQPLKEMIEPHVGIIKPHLGISKPVEALNKLHVNISLLRSYTLTNFAAPVVTTTFIDQTSAKAVACLYGQSCTRTT